MNRPISLIVVLLCFSYILSEQYCPIPTTPDGLTTGNTNNPALQLEAWYDLMCPDSAASFPVLWETLVQNYSILNAAETNTSFTIHIFPLPYHHYAFLVAQGFRVIMDNMNNSADAWNYINISFANQNPYTTANTTNFTMAQVAANWSTLISTAMPQYPDAEFYNYLMNETNDNTSQYNWEARVSWKYACSRGIVGTPTYYANGVLVDGADEFNTTSNWTNFLSDPANWAGIGPNL